MDSPTCARVSSFTRYIPAGISVTTERMSDDGWSLLDTARESFALHRGNNICFKLCFDDKIGLLFTGRRFWVAPVASIVASVIDDIKNKHPDTFVESNGRHTTRNTPVGVADVYQALACRTWIQGQGLSSGATIDDALRNARSYLANHCSDPFMALESSGLSIGSFTLAGVAPWKSSLIDNSPQLCVPSGRSCAATKSCFVLLDEVGLCAKFLRSRQELVFGIIKLL